MSLYHSSLKDLPLFTADNIMQFISFPVSKVPFLLSLYNTSINNKISFHDSIFGDTVLCSWARYLALTVPLSTQEYKWVQILAASC